MKIGITVKNIIENSPFNNGMKQHAFFFAQLCRKLGHNIKFLVLEKKNISLNTKSKNEIITEFEYIPLNTLNEDFDVIFCWELSLQNGLKYNYYKKGTIIINISVGTYMFRDIDNFINNILQDKIEDKNFIDLNWRVENQENYQYEQLIRDITFDWSMPYIWEPQFITNFNFDFDKNIKKFIIMEPNIDFHKSALFPLLMIEEYVSKNINEKIEIHLINGHKIDKYIKSINWFDINNFDNVKIFTYERLNFNKILDIGGIIISYQKYIPLNYAYFDALYHGVPLIHNSNKLKDFGFYYEGENFSQGLKHIDSIYESYESYDVEKNKEINRKFLKEHFSIDNTNIQTQFVNQFKLIEEKQIKRLNTLLYKTLN